MKRYILCVLVLLYTINTQAQTKRMSLDKYCSIDAFSLDEKFIYPLEPSSEARAILDTILQEVPIAKRTINLYAADVEMAIALVNNSKRYIIYDEFFVEKAKRATKDKWIVYFVFAHELAHHLNAHGLDSTENRPGTELEADKFAAATLAKLGANLDQTLAAAQFFTEKDTDTHPRKKTREGQILIGWKEGKDQLDKRMRKRKIVGRVEPNSQRLASAACMYDHFGACKIVNESSRDVTIMVNGNVGPYQTLPAPLEVKAGETAYFPQLAGETAFSYRVISGYASSWSKVKRKQILAFGQFNVRKCYERTILIKEK